MKSVVLASALAASIFLGVSGRPLDVKRAVVTELVIVTKTLPNVVIYVDENGAPYLTTTMEGATSGVNLTPIPVTTSEATQPTIQLPPVPELPPVSEMPSELIAAQPGPAPTTAELPSLPTFTTATKPTATEVKHDTPEPSSASPPLPPPSVPTEAPAPPQDPPTPQPSAAAPDHPTKQSESSNSLGLGVTYDPFGGSQESARCKTEEEITSEFNRMRDYKAVRIYGLGCNIIPIAMKLVLKNNQKLMAGSYLTTRGNGEDLSMVIKTLKSAVDRYAGGNWDVVQMFSVENERVNDHDMTASAVIDAINRARDQLRGLGYNGPVGAVETVPAMMDNLAICQASDVVMVNCHAFFDVNTVAEDAGKFVKSEIARLKSACNNKRVVVTESGWPHQGNANGKAVPSPENQRKALESIRNNFDHDLFFHNAFDATWKGDSGSTFNAERYWGVVQ